MRRGQCYFLLLFSNGNSCYGGRNGAYNGTDANGCDDDDDDDNDNDDDNDDDGVVYLNGR